MEDYSSASQTVSELFAIGAPSRPLVVPLFLAYGVLIIAFGWGVWGSAGRKRALRVVGGLLVAYGVVGLAGPFSPIHLREALAAGAGTLTDTMHGIITMVLVLFMLLAIGFGAAAFGKRFRLLFDHDDPDAHRGWRFGSFGPTSACSKLADAMDGGNGAHQHRGFLLWVVVLAVALLRVQVERRQDNLDGRSDSG